MVLAVALAVVLALLATRGPSEADRRAAVRDVAERFAVAVTSYDYRRLDEDLAAVREMSTGNFRAEYEQVLGGPGFRDALRENEARARAEVIAGPFLASLSDDGARTFTVVQQEVTGKNVAEPRRQRVRVETVLVHTVKGWKVDRVEIS